MLYVYAIYRLFIVMVRDYSQMAFEHSNDSLKTSGLKNPSDQSNNIKIYIHILKIVVHFSDWASPSLKNKRNRN